MENDFIYSFLNGLNTSYIKWTIFAIIFSWMFGPCRKFLQKYWPSQYREIENLETIQNNDLKEEKIVFPFILKPSIIGELFFGFLSCGVGLLMLYFVLFDATMTKNDQLGLGIVGSLLIFIGIILVGFNNPKIIINKDNFIIYYFFIFKREIYFNEISRINLRRKKAAIKSLSHDHVITVITKNNKKLNFGLFLHPVSNIKSFLSFITHSPLIKDKISYSRPSIFWDNL